MVITRIFRESAGLAIMTPDILDVRGRVTILEMGDARPAPSPRAPWRRIRPRTLKWKFQSRKHCLAQRSLQMRRPLRSSAAAAQVPQGLEPHRESVGHGAAWRHRPAQDQSGPALIWAVPCSCSGHTMKLLSDGH